MQRFRCEPGSSDLRQRLCSNSHGTETPDTKRRSFLLGTSAWAVATILVVPIAGTVRADGRESEREDEDHKSEPDARDDKNEPDKNRDDEDRKEAAGVEHDVDEYDVGEAGSEQDGSVAGGEQSDRASSRLEPDGGAPQRANDRPRRETAGNSSARSNDTGRIAIVYRDGTREEIRNGIYSKRSGNGAEVTRRQATNTDWQRLKTLARQVRKMPRSYDRGDSPVSQAIRQGRDMEIAYADGWVERVAKGRYVLTDPNGNTVAHRAVRFGDIDRMRAAMAGM
ncbi:MAG: hypothetical protein ACWA5A_08685 [Marinibacterium sp.]